MTKKAHGGQRREESLSRDRIIEESIELLDYHGEAGLTFRALSERLVTGPGAIYWHIASKKELLTAACDTIVARAIPAPRTGAAPDAAIRALALGIFDAIEKHPWVGSALTQAPGPLPIVRITEHLGQQIRALGVPAEEQWAAVSALLHYILGVASQNAINNQLARRQGTQKSDYHEATATAWSQLDPDHYPFVRGVANQLRTHDDRTDFLAGINLILTGITQSTASPSPSCLA